MEIALIESLLNLSLDKYVRVAVDGTEGLVRLLCFEPHQAVPLHRHPDADEVFYVKKGEGEITVGSEQARVGEGCLIRAPVSVSHGWKNLGGRLVLISFLIHSADYGLAERITRMEFV